jgi:hypothetical protein
LGPKKNALHHESCTVHVWLNEQPRTRPYIRRVVQLLRLWNPTKIFQIFFRNTEAPDLRDAPREYIFAAGKSKRIWNELYKVIDSSDVVIQVLDARDPIGTRSSYIENYLKKEKAHKHMILVLNKVDLVPTWVAKKWVALFSAEYPTVAFHASMKHPFGKGAIINLLRQFGKLHKDNKQISVGFIGYPNVGKSSVINAVRSKKVKTIYLHFNYFWLLTRFNEFAFIKAY